MKKAIFLDRDGVINKRRVDYVKNVTELEILPDVGKAIKKLNNNGYLVIVVTNQSVINRKLISKEVLGKIHEFLIYKISEDGGKITSILYCPHMSEENCSCRKPKPGLILRGIKEFSIDKNNSLLIGDSDEDLTAAKRAGMKGIKIQTNRNLLKFIEKKGLV